MFNYLFRAYSEFLWYSVYYIVYYCNIKLYQISWTNGHSYKRHRAHWNRIVNRINTSYAFICSIIEDKKMICTDYWSLDSYQGEKKLTWIQFNNRWNEIKIKLKVPKLKKFMDSRQSCQLSIVMDQLPIINQYVWNEV